MSGLCWFRAHKVHHIAREVRARGDDAHVTTEERAQSLARRVECVAFNVAVAHLHRAASRADPDERADPRGEHATRAPAVPVQRFRQAYDWIVELALADEARLHERVRAANSTPSDLATYLAARAASAGAAAAEARSPGAEDVAKDVAADEDSDARRAVRAFVRRKLEHVFRDAPHVPTDRIEALLAHAQPALADYRAQARRVLANLHNERSGLYRKVVDASVSAEVLARGTHREMWPEFWSRAELQPGRSCVVVDCATESAGAGDAHVSLLKCVRCHKNTVETAEFQTRSADEPMTVFCHCTSCGKRWKIC